MESGNREGQDANRSGRDTVKTEAVKAFLQERLNDLKSVRLVASYYDPLDLQNHRRIIGVGLKGVRLMDTTLESSEARLRSSIEAYGANF